MMFVIARFSVIPFTPNLSSKGRRKFKWKTAIALGLSRGRSRAGILSLNYILFCLPASANQDSFIEAQRKHQADFYNKIILLDKRLNNRDDAEKKAEGQEDTHTRLPFKPRPLKHIDSVAYPAGKRDPFAVPSRLLQNIVSNRGYSGKDNQLMKYAFSRTTVDSIPKIKLKGVLTQRSDDSPLAMILMNNETYMVRENDEIGFNPLDPSQVIKIKKIDRLSMLVEIGTLGELVIIR